MFRTHQLAAVTALALWACGDTVTVVQIPETGGSAKGDLGPPQGDPIQATLTFAPNVPPPTGRKAPAKVVVTLDVIEKVMPIADGTEYMFWTFGGEVPGKMIRIRQGDTVEFHLRNHPDNRMPHNIDLHAVTGPGGGAASSNTTPGHESVFSFKALNQGVYVYHCATAPVGMHIANGMYGLIVVEPPEGYAPVDREYYLMQGDFYTTGAYQAGGLQPFDMQKAIDENPTYVLFNGKAGALTGDGMLKANVGETVRLFVGNGGPNLVSSFHLIGEIFDKVYDEGGTRFQENVQTTLIPAGGSAVVEFKVEAPGTYVIVDHSIFRTFNKGALGLMQIEGGDQLEIYSGKTADNPWTPEGATPKPEAPKAGTKAERITAGEQVFLGNCAACHQQNGQGMPQVFPPLAGSDFLMADVDRSIDIVLKGLTGEIQVNGATFNGVMPPLGTLSDEEVANVLTYVRNSWGNSGDAVEPAQVAAKRAAH